ncbi:UNVERIFIED_ORG: hypothetical protein J2Y77_002680 [Pseudomonas lini]
MTIRRSNLAVFGLLAYLTCATGHSQSTDEKMEAPAMWMTVGNQRFSITLDDNPSARALVRQLPLRLDMRELNGNEKYASLPAPLVTNATRPGTLRNGDLMLYGDDTLVVFYSTLKSSYAYTRLGRVNTPDDLPKTLGPGDVQAIFSRD